MRSAFSEHWRGVAAGAALLVIGFLSVALIFEGDWWWRTDYVGGADEAFARYAPAPENEATAVVENPYAMVPEGSTVPPFMEALTALTLLLMFVLPGVLAARMGSSIVAWRGALAGLIGSAFLLSITTLHGPLELAMTCIVPGLLAYLGGGVARLLTWTRTRAA